MNIDLDAELERRMASFVQAVKPVSDEEYEIRLRSKSDEDLRQKIEDLRHSWNVPKRHATAKIEYEGVWGAKSAAIAEKIGTGALFGIVGTRGNGKTQLAVEAMRKATQRLLSARYETAMSIFTRLKASFRKDGDETEMSVIEDLRKPKLLVIDEVGKRGETDWENNLLFSIVDHRYGDMTDTILIANLEKPAFLECVGLSIASRMNQTGGLIVADWQSRR